MQQIIVPSNICSAFGTHSVIGSKVINHAEFNRILLAAVAAHDFSADRIPGQGFILIPEAIPFVSSGVGRPTENPDDYALHLYRGRVSAFLRRERAAREPFLGVLQTEFPAPPRKDPLCRRNGTQTGARPTVANSRGTVPASVHSVSWFRVSLRNQMDRTRSHQI